MFRRTVSFLRKLVGGNPDAAPGQAGEPEERRVRVRYPSGVRVHLQAQNGTGGLRLSARVRDISLGGISLLVERPFEPGELLSIELPGPGGETRSTALACVVHATARGDEWVVGCTFAHELTDADLQPFGARRERPSTPDDARGWVRFPVNVTATCQEVAAERQTPWSARVLNLSSSGIGMVVSRSVEPGSLLNLELHRGSEQPGHTILACVVHVTPQEGGSQALGCNFIRELTEEELKSLL